MKQSLQLRASQNFAMTPQLQQSIKMLQLSSCALQQEIRHKLESNMMLEVDETCEKTTADCDDNAQHTHEAQMATIPDEAPMKRDYNDVFANTATTDTYPATTSTDWTEQYSAAVTLKEYLLQQLNTAPLNAKQNAIAVAIIDGVNSHGYITDTLPEIYEGLRSQLQSITLAEVHEVWLLVQEFEPVGVAAQDLADCLAVQLRHLPANQPFKLAAIDLVRHYLPLLAGRDFAKLRKRLLLSEAQLQGVIALIKTLDPKPGNQIQNISAQYVSPDVFVYQQHGTWQVSLNPDITPKLRVNTAYSKMIKQVQNRYDNENMKTHLQEARWLLKSLANRNETLLLVAQCIVARQQAFLEHGAIAMLPITRREIARELQMHESTISRAVTGKYMQTPSGVVEFKSFFVSGVATAGGGKCSATAIKVRIKELLSGHCQKPLSDNKISALLKADGIAIARRTVSKYRKAMSDSAASH